MIVQSMLGLGDNIYQRAFIEQLEETVYLDTPWPEIYQGLPHVRFTEPRQTGLRTQGKNIARQEAHCYTKPPGRAPVKIRYRQEGPLAGMAKCFGVSGRMHLPSFSFPRQLIQKPYALIRPATVRREWRAQSRNCKPEYLAEAAQWLQSFGLPVVSVADLEDGEEWLDGPAPPADIQLHRGELNVEELLALVENAWMVVGPVGWIVPACLAYKTPAWIISGGLGGFNHPDKVAPPELRQAASMEFAVPDNFCNCTDRNHDCDKTITHHDARFLTYLDARARNGVAPETTH